MLLCANENVGAATVERLRQVGHDVLWIRENCPGSTDSHVLAVAQEEGRLLLTFDKDFGDLVYQKGADASTGVVLFRILQPSAEKVAERICSILASREDWAGHYSVVDDSTIRMRRLPKF